MPTLRTAADPCADHVREALTRIAGDLSLVVGRPFAIEALATTREATRPSGASGVHIAFKLGFEAGGTARHGALLVPLADAITMSALLQLLPDSEVRARRADSDLDAATKAALLEISTFVAGAVESALRERLPRGVEVRSRGCQGLRASQPPALGPGPGGEFAVGRARARITGYPRFELVLALPVLPGKQATAAVPGAPSSP